VGHRGRSPGRHRAVCLIPGGWSEQKLPAAGAVAVFESVQELRERLDETPLGAAPGRAAARLFLM
jgi:hypothetical protein